MARHIPLLCAAALSLFVYSSAMAEEKKQETGERTLLKLADGKLTLKSPAGWKRVKPKTRIVEYEFSVPPVKGDERPGRVTVMGAGGSVEANIDRWVGKFRQPDRKSTRQRTQVEKKQIAGQTVHVVDITGIYRDQLGPFAPAKYRENYRQLAAIIVTEKLGQHFVKFVGPRRTVAANEKAFAAMLETLQVVKQ